MKISLNWIRKYVDLPEDINMDELSHKLTMSCVEVERTENIKDELNNIVAGKIISVKPHPNADRLRITEVDAGNETLQIVCGGKNLYEGEFVVVSKLGAFVRWHGEGEKVEITPQELRGVPSSGMICGASEIGMEELFPVKDDHEIMDITELNPYPGQEISDLLNLDDIILEIDNKSLTNRPDLWGHYGIAREIAAIYKKPLKEIKPIEINKNLPQFPVEIEDEKLCTRYMAAVYDKVHVKQSPMDIKTDLWKCGVRPINSIVDMTNWVMLAAGQPTHGFDKNHISERIVIRPAVKGEKLTLLDGKVIELTEDNLIIADSSKPIALAGIMGGEDDSVNDKTESIILEIGTFSPGSVRHTASSLGLRTEASMRFEKALDEERPELALSMADELIKRLYPEAEISAFTDVYPHKKEEVTVDVTLEFLNKRLGRELKSEEVEDLLKPLGFKLEENEGLLKVSVPSWRATGDVDLPDDILEETARMIGYENFEYQPPTITLEEAINQKEYDLDRSIREYLAQRCAMQEVFTYPWTHISYIRAAGLEGEDYLKLSSPPSPEEENLRVSLIPGLLEVIEKNLRYFSEFRVFESTQVYRKGNVCPDIPEEVLPLMERNFAGAIVSDNAEEAFRQARGIIEMLPRYAMCEPLTFDRKEKPQWADMKAWLTIMSGDEEVGSLSLLSLKTMNQAGIKRKQVAVFTVNLEKLRPFHSRHNVFTHLPQFPLTYKDLSLITDNTTPWSEIEKIIAPEVGNVEFIEEYRGKQIPEGKKSITLSVSFGSDKGTLTNDEIEDKMNTIMKKLKDGLGAEVRGI